MANQTFAATVEAWVKKVKDAEETIFKASAQRLARELTDEVERLVYAAPPAPSYPRRTGFLRASLRASNTEMPLAVLDNPGGSHEVDWGQIELVINGSDIGDTIYLGYTARYGPHVHHGANGRPPKPWVDLVAMRWQQIVSEVAAEVRKEAGL